MRQFWLLLLLVAITGTNCYANEADDGQPQDVIDRDPLNERFTDKEIKKNVQRYTIVVFGEKEPTLQDYLEFEGAGSEFELTFELQECERRKWSPPFDSPECVRFTRTRANDAARVPSYYYRFLRSLVKTKNKKLVIHEVRHVNKGKREIQVVLVDAMLGETPIQFYHAGDNHAVPLGLVGISKIDGEDITEILKKRKKTVR